MQHGTTSHYADAQRNTLAEQTKEPHYRDTLHTTHDRDEHHHPVPQQSAVHRALPSIVLTCMTFVDIPPNAIGPVSGETGKTLPQVATPPGCHYWASTGHHCDLPCISFAPLFLIGWLCCHVMVVSEVMCVCCCLCL